MNTLMNEQEQKKDGEQFRFTKLGDNEDLEYLVTNQTTRLIYNPCHGYYQLLKDTK